MTGTLKNMTETLTERRRYIEIILENITTGVVSITPDGFVTTFNRAASRILRIDQEQVLNQHYRGFWISRNETNHGDYSQNARGRSRKL